MDKSVGNRISELIKLLNLKNVQFAQALNIDPSFVSQLISGKRNASDRTILDICRIYDVNEQWLRSGEGDIFIEKTREEEIGAFIGDVISGDDEFKKAFISTLAELNEDGWSILRDIAFKIVEKHQESIKGANEAKKSEP